MAGGIQSHKPVDLFLLAAGLNGDAGSSSASIAKDVQAATGMASLMLDDTSAILMSRAADRWFKTALDDGTLKRASDDKSRAVISKDGIAQIKELFGASILRRNWSEVTQRVLVARALGLPANAGPQRLKRLDTTTGLRQAIVRKGWSLKVPESATIGQVRNALAARALADAFGQSISGQLGANARLSAKAGRAIAAQLLSKRRRVSTDAQLLTALAAQHLGVATGDARSLRQALLCRLFGISKKVKPRVDKATLDVAKYQEEQAPDVTTFLKAVKSSAKLNANGWSGNRKAYISHVWRSVCDSHPEWRLGADTFKTKLIEAHQDGQIVLAHADLRDKNNIRDVQDSAIQHHNMEWHFVQIAE